MDEEILMGFVGGILLGCALTILILGLTGELNALNESTLNDICVTLSNGKATDYEITNGKLICVVPSKESPTPNILIKSNGAYFNAG